MSILLLVLSFHFDVMINTISNFLSSARADDIRTIVQAKIPATPWNTIAELRLFFCGFAAKETVLFNPFYGNRTMLKKKNPIIILLN